MTKGFFFLMRIDRIIPKYWFSFLAHASDLSKWISENKKCGYNDFYTISINLSKREELYNFILHDQNLNEGIDYLEFGVASGKSFKWWLTHVDNKDARFYGFDTFTGLPENWGRFRKGDLNNGNKVPEISDDRHKFYQGLFQQTLVPFLKNYQSEKRKVIHLDADLYSSTLFVLTQIATHLKTGDILLFDEFNVPMHEFNAFDAWVKAFYIKYKVLGGINNFHQVAIKIE